MLFYFCMNAGNSKHYCQLLKLYKCKNKPELGLSYKWKLSYAIWKHLRNYKKCKHFSIANAGPDPEAVNQNKKIWRYFFSTQ